MLNPSKRLELQTIYGQEQAIFAKMQEAERMRKRRIRRLRVLRWLVRRL